MPAVSVLVPAYNAQPYLRECLGSLVAQTLTDIEMICIDDGSKDATLEIMREYAAADGRISIIEKDNSGYGDSLNRGLEVATGEYLTILESDDYFPPDACEAMYEFAKSNDLDWLKADAQVFFGEKDERTFTPAPATQYRTCYSDVVSTASNPGHFPSRAGLPNMYKRSFLEKNAIRFNPSPGASFQDSGFWAQAMFAGRRVRFLDHVCYLIRRDNPNSSELDRGKIYAICREYDFIRARIEQMEGVEHDVCVRSCAYFRLQGYLWNCSRIQTSAVEEFLEYAAKEFRALDAAGEIDRTYFTALELDALESIISDPIAYGRRVYGTDKATANKDAAPTGRAALDPSGDGADD